MAATGRLSGASVFPLSTLDPAAALDDLKPLFRLIPEDVGVVAIGESAHGAHEFYALRHRLIRFLVERMNFTALVWESGFPESFLVDDYIHGRQQDRQRVQVDGMTMHMGRCQEMGDLLDWLREHNGAISGASRSVRFYGLDLPGSTAPFGQALDVVAPYVQSVDRGFGARLTRLGELAASFGPPPSATPKTGFAAAAVLRQYMARPATDRNELTALLADLAVRFDALRRSYTERSDAMRYDLARQHLRVAAQLDLQLRAVAALMGGDTAACEASIRDLTMADTVQWVLGKEQRIIVLAHNGHIQKTPIATPAGTTATVDTLGVHLADRLGQRYLTIGTTCGGGEIIAMRTVPGVDGSYDSELYIRDLPPAGADTIDTALDSILCEVSLLELRGLDGPIASAIATAHRMRVQDQIVDLDVRRAFDLLIHVPRISLWTSAMNTSMPDERGRKTSGC